jgi:hypothetical protein
MRGCAFRGTTNSLPLFTAPIHCPYSLPLFTAPIHWPVIHMKGPCETDFVYPLPIHCLFTAYSLACARPPQTRRDEMFTCSPVFSHMKGPCETDFVYPLPIHCLFTAYSLPIHWPVPDLLRPDGTKCSLVVEFFHT